MSENLSQKEILLRLMDKMDNVEREQTNHHSFAKTKLESIEAQAIKTNGRVLKLEKKTVEQDTEINKVKVIFSTLSVVLSVAWAGITFIFQ
jgi:hypothetical protein